MLSNPSHGALSWYVHQFTRELQSFSYRRRTRFSFLYAMLIETMSWRDHHAAKWLRHNPPWILTMLTPHPSGSTQKDLYNPSTHKRSDGVTLTVIVSCYVTIWVEFAWGKFPWTVRDPSTLRSRRFDDWWIIFSNVIIQAHCLVTPMKLHESGRTGPWGEDKERGALTLEWQLWRQNCNCYPNWRGNTASWERRRVLATQQSVNYWARSSL